MELMHTKGFVGQQLVKLLLELHPTVKLITTDIVQPPNHGVTDTSRLRSVKADLGKQVEIDGLLKDETIGGVFALQYVFFNHLLRTPSNFSDVAVLCLEAPRQTSLWVMPSMLTLTSIS